MNFDLASSCTSPVLPLFLGYLLKMEPDKIIAWATLLTAGATLLGVVFAVIFFLAEGRRSRFQAGVEILLKFNEEFDNNRMWSARKKAVEAIKKDKTGEADKAMDDTGDVLDFFEIIAFLVRRRAIDKYFVWHSFFYWIHRYYVLCQDYISSEQQKPGERAKWEDLVWLYPRLLRIEKKRNHCSDDDLKLTQRKVDQFISEEEEM
jgi:hypothetical protein